MALLPPRVSKEHFLGPQTKPAGVVHFGDFDFDCASGDLRRHGVSLRLQPQPAKILSVLVRQAGEIVSRQELVEQVWGSETFVDYEQGLNYAIRQIRAALEDDAEQPRFVETLPKRGYRFIAEVEKISSPLPQEVLTASRPANEKAPMKSSRRSWVWPAFGGVCALLIAVALRFGAARSTSGNAGGVPIQSIAVLPLVNLSADPSQEYFSDGLTDELITELAKAGKLRVISRTSIIAFKGSRKRTPDIGRDLHVDAIVEGTVERVGGRVRIRTQLIRAATDQHLWAESYDRDLGDLLGLEREVAREIAQQIGYRVSQRELTASKVAAPAHEDYLKGRYYWNKRTEAGLRKGIEYFQKAIDQEPNYALAYAGLADSYIMLANWGFTPPGDAYLKAKAAAAKALDLDDQLAEAQTSLAYATLLSDWDWPEAERSFRRAISLNPNYASAHHFYSILLLTAGRQSEALVEIRRAQELDPLSLIVNDVAGWVYYEGRNYDQAVQQYRKTLEMDSSYAPALLDLGTAYLRLKDYHHAIALFEKARAASGENGVVLSDLAQAYALSGKKLEARSILQKLQKPSSTVFVSSWDMALIYVALSDRQRAIALLQKSADEHVGWVVRLGVDPALDNLRTDPQFQELKQRIRIPMTVEKSAG